MAAPNTFSSGVNTSFSTELNENFTYVEDELDKKEGYWELVSTYTLPTALSGADSYTIATGETWDLDDTNDYMFVFNNYNASNATQGVGLAKSYSSLTSMVSGSNVSVGNTAMNNSEFILKQTNNDDYVPVLFGAYYYMSSGAAYSPYTGYVEGQIALYFSTTTTLTSLTFRLYKRPKVYR